MSNQYSTTLENLRNRLLDLTARNRLLNFKPTKTASLRIIDELPNQLVDTLLNDKEMTFSAVSEPTRQQLIDHGYIVLDPETNLEKRVKKDPSAEEWAKYLNINTSYEVPHPQEEELEAKHTDTEIQTLLFPYELETRLRNLRTKANTAIQETGSNILYLALGFLEWHDHGKKYFAPLYLFPANLEKGKMHSSTKTYDYILSSSGEGVLPNLSLREKLSTDFNLALPDFDEEVNPEVYFKQVQDLLLQEKLQWKVHRYITLTLLNFAKLLMYLDLDSSRWPDNLNITEHSIVKRFLSGYQVNAEEDETEYTPGFSEEYEIDDIPNIHDEYPIIEDADSSQHSALIDVVKGKNLVIEGPPGTGKSQTITNLIAALLAQGKKVLFVAEKLAALEVVKGRLDRAGLGDFCLELHSNKTQKRKVINDIANRIERKGRYRKPSDIRADITRYEDLKKSLSDYVEAINKKFKETGKSIHEILMAATRHRENLAVSLQLVHPDGINADIYTPSKQREINDDIAMFSDGYAALISTMSDKNSIASHPWYGVTNTAIQLFDYDQIKYALLNWQQTLSELTKSHSTILTVFSGKQEDFATVSEFTELLSQLNKVSELKGNEIIEALSSLKETNINKFRTYIALHSEIQELFESLAKTISPELLSDLSFVDSLKEGTDQLEKLFWGQNTIAPGQAIEQLTKLETALLEISVPRNEIASNLPENIRNLISLNHNGIKELKDFVLNISSIKPNLLKHRDDIFDNDELDDILPRIDSEIKSLKNAQSKLKVDFKLDRVPRHAQYIIDIQNTLTSGGLFKLFSGKWKNAKKELFEFVVDPKAKVKDIVPLLDLLIEFKSKEKKLLNDRECKTLLGEHFEGLATNTTPLIELRGWYQQIRRCYGVGFEPKAGLGNAILDLPAPVSRAVRSLKETGYIEQLNTVSEEITSLKSVFKKFKEFDQSNIEFVGSETALIPSLQNDVKTALHDCQTLIRSVNFSVSDIVQQVNSLQTLKKKVDVWLKADHDNILFNGKLGIKIGVGVKNKEALSAAQSTIHLAEHVNNNLDDFIVQLIYKHPDPKVFSRLKTLSEKLKTLCANHNSAYDVFAEKVGLTIANWLVCDGGSIEQLIHKNERALSCEQELQTYLDYLRTRSKLVGTGFQNLVNTVERGAIAVEDINTGSLAGIYDVLVREIFEEEPIIANFSGVTHESLRKQFKSYDEKLKSLKQADIAWKVDQKPIPRGSSGGRVSQYTDLVLLEHECGKKTRHIPIRQLVKRAGDALVGLKPCFMMGPMSVAQYLEPGQFAFDVVVMDEASQIKPEYALGTIARGEQLVVVGDPKQLPPTSFFDKLIREDEEDPTALEESESILDATLPIFNSRRLRWHYRSQHESLIAFSNHSFYNSNLVIFPSPKNKSKDYGVKYTRLNRGCFISRRNNREAEVISDAVKTHLINYPDETVGIVAMSSEQRSQIERAVDLASKEDPIFRQLLEKDGQRSESLFIKNLENVQGDERDVILISMTYGPAEVGGKVYQRFGPINSEVGWRRLNVLFTRSRKRMHIFSSMDSSDIVVTGTSKLGVKALRDFLQYCETGNLNKIFDDSGNRPPDSDFEISVMEALSAHGFECVPQVGVAGFFIDIAVRDPGNPGSYLMGIECDGATYHSAKSVRDRDRLRQTILERLGWKIRRIWSTGWFKDPKGQLAPIINELNDLRTFPVVDEGIDVEDECEPAEQIVEAAEAASDYAPALPKDVPELEKQHEAAIDDLVAEDLSLKEKLIKYDLEITKNSELNIPENGKLLRPAMLEALMEYLPTSKSEFLEVIPFYLREATASGQGHYLEAILDIITAEYE